MIDSRASSSLIPKCVIDTLEMKCEPIVKEVLQLDGRTIKTVEILRNFEMALHVYPSCIVLKDISIDKVKPHFSIFL